MLVYRQYTPRVLSWGHISQACVRFASRHLTDDQALYPCMHWMTAQMLTFACKT